MAEMGAGYGSECHLLRYLGRHRTLLDKYVSDATRGDSVAWIDYPFDARKAWLDGELTGLDFLEMGHPAHEVWRAAWPQRGNPPNWDAVARLSRNGAAEWVLIEAKANVQELRQSCKASVDGGRPLIARTLSVTKAALGVAEDRDWLDGYYQYCNRPAVLELLIRHGVPARLMFIYFLGDKSGPTRTCPADVSEWRSALEAQSKHVGLSKHHPIRDHIHELFIEVCPRP